MPPRSRSIEEVVIEEKKRRVKRNGGAKEKEIELGVVGEAHYSDLKL